MKGMLFSQMEPPAALEAEFNDWYETEHIPVRLALPGFARAVRYREVGAARKYLAIYELDDMAVLESPGYGVVKTQPSARTAHMLKSVAGFTRFTCTLASQTIHAPGESAYLSAYASASAVEAGWTAGTGVLRTRRYDVVSADGGPWRTFVLEEVTSPAAPGAVSGHGAHWLYEVVSVHAPSGILR